MSPLYRVNDAGSDWQPDPMSPGAQMIPRTGWDTSPHNRWTWQRVREWTPTASIWGGRGPVLPLPQRLSDIDGIEFEANGRRSTIRQFLDSSFTDGFLVLSRGEIISETYMNGMEPHTQHLAHSVTKSIAGTLFGILVHKGLIDTDSLVTRYLPELEATAYRAAKVQHVLDMTAGVKYSVANTAPYIDEQLKPAATWWENEHIEKLAMGWWPMDYAKYPDFPKNTWEIILRLTEQEAPHGARFSYRGIENDVLGFIMQRVTGKMLPELFSSELWAPMGAEEDAYITVDQARFALTDGGFNATLRDYARFALLHLRGGRLNGKQIVPSEWIEKTRGASDDLFRIFGGDGSRLPKGAYHNTFWIEDPERRAFMCSGYGGQLIYIDPQADFAVVKLSHYPDDGVSGRSAEALAAIHAIRDMLAGR
ncbi:MAG: class C beta-lactamase-related serine hydrolase [Mesorhizobium sp.]|nr:MAG: class C beta-lactamase-related serine hydrolase [Mesorhizobium sp.]